jgi:23S rRNA (cytosine1962-C5)-methyltransferase
VKGDPRAGDPVVVFDRKNRFLAAGLWDPEGPIRIRVLTEGAPETVGEDLFRHRVRRALERRRALLGAPEVTGIRLLHGESDGLSGLVADRFGDRVVLKVYSAAWVPHLATLARVLAGADGFGPAGPPASEVLVLVARRLERSPLLPPALRHPALLETAEEDGPRPGAEPAPFPGDGALPFLEHGLHFEAHPLVGHKTGFYLDQRDNRRRLRERTGARVLNVFSYTGGFSVAAARGGAREVTSLDVSAPALAQAERHFRLNAHEPAVAAARHRTLEGDAFELLRSLATRGERFDTVVIDPPSFAKDLKSAPGALEHYTRLTTLGVALLEPGGLLVQASCSSRVSADDFHLAVHRGAREAGRPLAEIERTGHPLDHPVVWPESAYLKALWARVP